MAGQVEPIRQILLKVHSRCNLACDYCYVYENVDQSWRQRPQRMSPTVLTQAVRRIAQHCERHALPFVSVIFHGGEPLLAGPRFIERATTELRSVIPPATEVRLHLQTNGVALTGSVLEMLDRGRIRVGVSLDGDQGDNDRHRVHRDGRGSHGQVVRALRLLNEERFRHLYGGILCTINLASDPLAVYGHLLTHRPPRIDFLLPHGNWTVPPPGRPPDLPGTPYADWLIPIFDDWYDTWPQRTGVRLFESLIDLVIGGRSGTEVVGLTPTDIVTIETDGAIEYGDALKTTAAGMTATGLHVSTSGLDDVLARPAFQAQRSGLAGLSATCRACPVVHVCGGGQYAHRYRRENGFDNPSVYCPDLMRLISHVRSRVAASLHATVGSDL